MEQVYTDRDHVRHVLALRAHRFPGGGTPRASVAAILTPEMELLLIRRATNPRDPWSGHVSLPGGRVDSGDENPLAAAVREVEEEIGLSLESAEFLGELDEVSTIPPLPDLWIRPHVFALDTPPTIRINYEVRSVHRVSLHDLLSGRGRGRMEHVYRDQPLTLPCVDFPGGRLWGLTLRIVDDLLHRLDARGIGLERPCERSIP